ncbi:MAG: uroporphyrinogen decarboxylase family protein [Candidatus Humimicrobiaceae bacterium]
MTSRERLLNTYLLKDVDRKPISPFIHINFIRNFYKDENIDLLTKTIDVYKYFGFDIVHRNCSPIYDESLISCDTWKVFKQISEKDEKEKEETMTIITPEGELTQKKMMRKTSQYMWEEAIKEFFIKGEHDLELFIKYQPHVSNIDSENLKKTRQIIGEDGVVAPWVNGAVGMMRNYRSFQDMLVDALVNEHFYRSYMEYFTERCFEINLQVSEAGADILSYNANAANSKVMSTLFFRSYIMPYEEHILKKLADKGILVNYHNCGPSANLLPVYNEMSMRGYESLAEYPFGDTTLDHALSVFSEEKVLSGNIDQIYFLKTASPKQVESKVKEIADKVKRRKHFIIATTDYIEEDTPVENIEALGQCIKYL